MRKLLNTICYVLIATLMPFALVWAGPLEESLIYHTYFGTVQEVQRLLNKGADVNAKDEHGWPALAIAAARNDIHAFPIAQALIQKGANINAGVGRDFPLVNAILNKNERLVEVLMSRDVFLYITDKKGNSMPALAKAMGNNRILYMLEKRLFEEQQTKTFLYSPIHLWQIARRYVFDNCALQYWGFYYKSGQDKKVNLDQLRKRINGYAAKAQQDAAFGSRYFAALQAEKLKNLTAQARGIIYNELNAMISNRNRREQGVGTEKDFQKRCQAVTKKLQQQGTELILR